MHESTCYSPHQSDKIASSWQKMSFLCARKIQQVELLRSNFEQCFLGLSPVKIRQQRRTDRQDKKGEEILKVDSFYELKHLRVVVVKQNS